MNIDEFQIRPENKTDFLRKVVEFRHTYAFVVKNKSWLFAILYISSIIKEVIWYSMFGVDILAFASIEDTITSFINQTITILVFVFIYFSLHFSISEKYSLWKCLLVIFLWVVTFITLGGINSLISDTYIILVFILLFTIAKQYIVTYKLIIVSLLCLCVICPILDAIKVKSDLDKPSNMVVLENRLLKGLNNFTFEYEGKIYFSNPEAVMVGQNTKYFFLYDKVSERTRVIPKDKVKNIQLNR